MFKAEHKESKKLVALKRLVKFANEEDGVWHLLLDIAVQSLYCERFGEGFVIY